MATMSREGDMESSHEHIGGIWIAEALLVVAILMATVAFQARFNPPGGVWQDTGFHNPTANSEEQVAHKAGQSTLWYVNENRYRWFAISNDFTLALSLLTIQLLLARSFSKSSTKLLYAAIGSVAVALVCMSVTYFAAAFSIAQDPVQYYTCTLVLFFSTVMCFLLWKSL